MTDVLIVVATLVLLGFVLLPVFSRAKARPKRVNCISRLKEIGLAFHIWSNDNDDQFPWMTSTNGGTLKFTNSPNVFLHFQAASNELGSPKILACASDSGKKPASDFNKFDNRNLSYFIGLDSNINKPETILSGDRNLTTNGVALGSGVFPLTAGDTLGWTTANHPGGNVGLADGSAQPCSSAALQKQWLAVTNLVRRLAIP